MRNSISDRLNEAIADHGLDDSGGTGRPDAVSKSGGITRRGPCHLRAILIEAAWVAVRKVPVYQAMFERVACKGDRRTAIVAVARRMLEDAFTMLRKEQAFRYVRPDAGEKTRRPDPRIGLLAESSDAG